MIVAGQSRSAPRRGAHRLATRPVARKAIAAVAALLPVVALILVVLPLQADAGAPPTVIQHKVIGYSVQHRPITAYRLGNPNSHIKAVLLGQMHGDEDAGPVVARAVIHGKPVLGIDLWVIVTMNPDGNIVNTRGNAHGVDLNRNWPDNWTHLTGQFYSGPKALSEPETRAMYSFLSSVKPNLMVSVHQPLGGVDTTDGGHRNPTFAHRLAARIGLPLKAFTCGGVCRGSMTGWITHHQSGAAVTVEYPSHTTTAWLTAKTPPAIISSFGGSYDTAAKHNPVLRVEHATSHGSTVTISGWTFDPDARSTSIGMSVYSGSVKVLHVTASRPRADVNRAYGLTNGHGYSVKFAATNGKHLYCVAAGNVSYGTGNPRVCRTVSVNGDARGRFDSASAGSSSVTVAGWAYDPDSTSTSTTVQVRVGSTVIGTYPTNRSRPDVNSTYHITGLHGYKATFSATPGSHTYTIYAANLGSTKAHAFVSLGSKTVNVG
jgi:murein peptide amidase A